MYRRAVISEIKNDFQMIDEDIPALQAGEVLLELEAAALNRRDYWITQGLYPGLQLPCTPGSDGAGTITGLGADVADLSIGDEVIINPGMHWGVNQRAQDASFEVLGMPTNGTHASHIIIPADRIHAKPVHLDWQQAAALPLAYATAYRALFSQAQVQAGQRILVTGIGGGVAVAALQLAHAIGCEVIVTTSDEQKGQRALELGAHAFYNYRDENWVNQIIQNHGPIDAMIDGSGGDNVQAALNLCKAGGCLLMYGATAGAPKKLDVFKLFWKQIHIIGSSMASDEDFSSMLAFVQEHSITPLIDCVFKLSEINMAYAQQAHAQRMGKIVLQCKE